MLVDKGAQKNISNSGDDESEVLIIDEYISLDRLVFNCFSLCYYLLVLVATFDHLQNCFLVPILIFW